MKLAQNLLPVTATKAQSLAKRHDNSLLAPINGMRVLSTIFITVVHTIVMFFFHTPEVYEALAKIPYLRHLTMRGVMMDLFFTMTGFLTSYQIFKSIQSKNKIQKNLQNSPNSQNPENIENSGNLIDGAYVWRRISRLYPALLFIAFTAPLIFMNPLIDGIFSHLTSTTYTVYDIRYAAQVMNSLPSSHGDGRGLVNDMKNVLVMPFSFFSIPFTLTFTTWILPLGSYMFWTWNLGTQVIFNIFFPILINKLKNPKKLVFPFLAYLTIISLIRAPIIEPLLNTLAGTMKILNYSTWDQIKIILAFSFGYTNPLIRFPAMILGSLAAYIHVFKSRQITNIAKSGPKSFILLLTGLPGFIYSFMPIGIYDTIGAGFGGEVGISGGSFVERSLFYPCGVGLMYSWTMLLLLLVNNTVLLSPLNQILSHKIFAKLAPVTYSEYLFHFFFIIKAVAWGLTKPYSLSSADLAQLEPGDFPISRLDIKNLTFAITLNIIVCFGVGKAIAKYIEKPALIWLWKFDRQTQDIGQKSASSIHHQNVQNSENSGNLENSGNSGDRLSLIGVEKSKSLQVEDHKEDQDRYGDRNADKNIEKNDDKSNKRVNDSESDINNDKNHQKISSNSKELENSNFTQESSLHNRKGISSSNTDSHSNSSNVSSIGIKSRTIGQDSETSSSPLPSPSDKKSSILSEYGINDDDLPEGVVFNLVKYFKTGFINSFDKINDYVCAL